MAHRQLSEAERAVLAHRTVNPEGWWNHVCLMFTQAQAESRLADRVSLWRADYEAEAAQPGYLTLAQKKSD